MKPGGVSNDLPDYLKSRYSVTNPPKPLTAQKFYKTPLRQGVSKESPGHFHVNFVPVLDTAKKNESISKDLKNGRFSSDLKQNLQFSRAKFDYSEIKSQKFDYDTLKFIEGIDVKAGNSARISRLMGYNEMYFQTLNQGFGKSRGEFAVELSQSKVPRFEGRQIVRLSEFLSKTNKRSSVSQNASVRQAKPLDYSLEYSSSYCKRNVNTPNQQLRRKKRMTSNSVDLQDLDYFEADFKTKPCLVNATWMYKDI